MKSIVSYPTRGEYGNNKYRGNATGKLLIDLHKVYKFDEISDYMSGSFTTAGLQGESSKFDLIENDIKERNNFIYWHPPYWDMCVLFLHNTLGNKN